MRLAPARLRTVGLQIEVWNFEQRLVSLELRPCYPIPERLPAGQACRATSPRAPSIPDSATIQQLPVVPPSMHFRMRRGIASTAGKKTPALLRWPAELSRGESTNRVGRTVGGWRQERLRSSLGGQPSTVDRKPWTASSSSPATFTIGTKGMRHRSSRLLKKPFPGLFQRRLRKAWFSLRSRNQPRDCA